MLVAALHAGAEQRYILRVKGAGVQNVASRHGLLIHRGADGGGQGLFQATLPPGSDAGQKLVDLRKDPGVEGIELDRVLKLPESSASPQLSQSTAAILDALSRRAVASYFGTSALASYVSQPAVSILRVPEAQRLSSAGGGVVAVLDTGVDFSHPVLARSLVPGYDFTRELPGGSEMADLSQSTAAILDQSTAAILDKNTAAILNQSTAAILDQSTAAILDRNKLPAAFGHGTMVAGLVHLAAPAARIMPVKVFQSDGTSNLFDIVRGIYYAADRGAKVLNLSFSMAEPSDELMKALQYANSRRVIMVASAGNDGKQTLVYPAALRQVTGVASTSNQDRRSDFSNYGDALVSVAGPGEGVVTLYPGKNYALVWGTSFSTALLSGGAALLVGIDAGTNQAQADQALSQAVPVGQGLGAGRADLFRACLYRASHGGN